MSFQRVIENPFVKGVLVSIPVAFLSSVLGFVSLFLDVAEWQFFRCSPFGIYCGAWESVYVSIWMLIVGSLYCLFLLKSLRERAWFLLGFSVLFSILQIVLLSIILAVFIANSF